jgi:hypothetical protein
MLRSIGRTSIDFLKNAALSNKVITRIASRRDPFQQVMYQECLAELMRESVESGTDDGAADMLFYLAKSAVSEIVLIE